MRISDWSSDVCSSDLDGVVPQQRIDLGHPAPACGLLCQPLLARRDDRPVRRLGLADPDQGAPARSEERRGGEERVSTSRSRWSPYHSYKTNKRLRKY